MGGGICPGSATKDGRPGDCVDPRRGYWVGSTRSTGYCGLAFTVS